ncbi:MAG: YggT family protein [Treponema sp.]|nr:YggT family protein [Treponema sp.]
MAGMLSRVFSIISAVLTLYMMLCFVRVMLSWFPRLQYSTVGRFLSTLCDPYLHLFRGLRFLRFSAFDFSPAIALCILIALANIFSNLAMPGRITLGFILAMLLTMIWQLVSSVIGFLIVILVIRLVVILLQRGYSAYGSLWDQFDRALNPIVFRIASLFTRGQAIPYKTALIVSIVTLAAVLFAGKYAISELSKLLAALPL